MIGLELEDGRAIAVRVDDRGAVQTRAAVVAEGDLAAAATGALAAIEGSGADQHIIGVAAATPEAPGIAAAVAGLAPRFDGGFVQHGAIPSGVAAAVAEAWIGAARGVQDVVFFACGEHTTGGIIRGGAPMTGVRGRAAAVAWLALNPVEREDYRKTGCLEAEVAAAGIVRRLVWRVKSGDPSRVADAVNGDFAAITVQHVLDAARQRDGVAISVIRDTAKYLGMAAANVVVVVDPEMLVVGGIIASAADLLMDPLRFELNRRLPKATMEALRIETATLGDDAAAIGAARLVATATP
jgi:ROK family protein